MATKTPAPRPPSPIAEIQALRRMTVAELRTRWNELYGSEPRSRNRDYLWRRLAWKVQEETYGGLSEAARARLADLASEVSLGDLRVRPPKGFDPSALAEAAERPTAARLVRDPRLPRPGTVLVRPYRGRELRVLVLEDGFEWEGRRFGSLTETARAITGQHWNGRLFFGRALRNRAGRARQTKDPARKTDRRPASQGDAPPSDEDGRKGAAKPAVRSDTAGNKS